LGPNVKAEVTSFEIASMPGHDLIFGAMWGGTSINHDEVVSLGKGKMTQTGISLWDRGAPLSAGGSRHIEGLIIDRIAFLWFFFLFKERFFFLKRLSSPLSIVSERDNDIGLRLRPD